MGRAWAIWRTLAAAAWLGAGSSKTPPPQLSISSVPTYVAHEVGAVFSEDTTELRLQMARSYVATAHRFVALGDGAKVVACFAAARAWLRGCANKDGAADASPSRFPLSAARLAIHSAGAQGIPRRPVLS